MIVEEGPPRLRRRLPTSDHVFGHRGLGNLNTQLHEFAVNPRRAPYRVLATHCSNQIAGVTCNENETLDGASQ